MSGDINPECENDGTVSRVQHGFNSTATHHYFALQGGHFYMDEFELCKGLN